MAPGGLRGGCRMANIGGEAGAEIAQLVEHGTENPGVAGSIPALGTSFQAGAPLFGGRLLHGALGAVVLYVPPAPQKYR